MEIIRADVSEVKEEQIKNIIAKLYFGDFNCTNIEGNIDFCVTDDAVIQENLFYKKEIEYFLWAEAKKPKQKDLYKMFVQLILTIGKSNELRNKIPPKFLGAFNSNKIAFISYSSIQHIFSQNDFNWNVTPSNYNTKEFRELYQLVESTLASESYIFDLFEDEMDLKKFIKDNFKKSKKVSLIEITKNNFISVYTRWLKEVKDSIDIDWDLAQKANILDTDFFLADMLSENNRTEKEDLFVQLNGNHYEYNKKNTGLGVSISKVMFKDNQAAHTTFWLKYKRPPKTNYQDYIIESRHLLVPQDIREIKGAYFTPQVWVQKSQEYLSEVLGENWQDEYYIWDCCAGTGNMENGLVNKYNIWASTIDQADVDVMKERIKNGANLLESHIFQFDFLNDEFAEKCPKDLLNILNDSEKRKKLVIYINPPYKETTSTRTISSNESRHKKNIAGSKIKNKYQNILKQGSKELYVQFLTRCYFEIEGAYIANFSTLKTLQGVHFREFRDVFLAKLKNLFIVPASTFDNIKGDFPIGFFIWDTQEKVVFDRIEADIFNEKDQFIGTKEIINPPNKNIKDWLREYNDDGNPIGYLVRGSADIQNNRVVFITWKPSKSVIDAGNFNSITEKNLIENSIFYTIRNVIKATWINDRDQYLYPNNSWKSDKLFQSDCLVYTIFDNRIKSNDGINYWIPYSEKEVNAKNNFTSDFMSNYIKINHLEFSNAAKLVLDAGRGLWIYYHSKENSNPNASLLDIKEYFQNKDEKGFLKPTSTDEQYLMLLDNLTKALRVLADNIIPKVYEYGFLYKKISDR